MKSIYLFVILPVIILAHSSLANIYVFQPLEQLQTNVYAFANEPKKWEKCGIPKETLETILRQGTFTNKYMEWITLRKNLIDKRIDGVFFDVNGNGYKWFLIDTEMLHLESSSGQSGFVIFNNIPITPYLMPYEKTTATLKFNTLKVVGFIKDRPVTGPTIAVKKERIEKFLRNGKTLAVDEYNPPSEYKGRITDDSNGKVYERFSNYYHYSYETRITNSNGKVTTTSGGSGGKSAQVINVSGSILASDGNIYFWDLRDDSHLLIEDEHGQGCILSLEK